MLPLSKTHLTPLLPSKPRDHFQLRDVRDDLRRRSRIAFGRMRRKPTLPESPRNANNNNCGFHVFERIFATGTPYIFVHNRTTRTNRNLRYGPFHERREKFTKRLTNKHENMSENLVHGHRIATRLPYFERVDWQVSVGIARARRRAPRSSYVRLSSNGFYDVVWVGKSRCFRGDNHTVTCVFYDCPDRIIVIIIVCTMVTGTNEMRLDAIKNARIRCCIIRQRAAVLYEIPGGRRDRSAVTCRDVLCTGRVRGEMWFGDIYYGVFWNIL